MKRNEYIECGFKRVTSIIPEVRLGSVKDNVETIINLVNENKDADVLVFPELCITGYTLADLFHQTLLTDKAIEGLLHIATATSDSKAIIAVGLPLRFKDKLYNVAALIHKGKIVALIPKTHIPNYSEYYEARWFASAKNLPTTTYSDRYLSDIPFGTDIILHLDSMHIGVEICEDLWVPIPPSSYLCMGGANIILNLSASNQTIGKSLYRSQLIRQQSARCRCVYAYASAGCGESSTDLAFPGYAAIASDGSMIIETTSFPESPASVSADVDLNKIANDRLNQNTFTSPETTDKFLNIYLNSEPEDKSDKEILLIPKNPERHPFVPSDPIHRNENCTEIISIQCHGLATRLRAINCRTLVVGVSGGLDSTLALLVACRTFDLLKLPRTGIIGITMPGLATTSKTRNNAWKLMELLGITTLEIPIGKAVAQHFSDIGQDPKVYDATYENSQARERTQILMDYANKTGGIVLGTGDLSELALGWCTYNGDQMSMYGVNASVPKTLVKYLVEWFADRSANPEEADVLRDIIATPISPELVPSDSDADDIAQKTEDLVGPYELHDFFLYHILRNSFSPKKIFYLAKEAFKGEYNASTILKWLKNFYRRFFNQQFKRSCMPDGPKVGSVCLSPRGDWRMPSDALSAMWLEELEELENLK